ncbi:heat shock 70 kDa protein 12B-like isoform X2 [Ostrea edulis]|nr:heat shock 70 kDa protein 12B-like isoform X2 [Ostrea edulis]XP_048744918.1 heat shock 70 kDa protein 12B-like isoform X2 [Ostrea edulis]XP_048744919.1 heat shock 70 kDa protein 12B-like isoform X2 [Ostrea edulis]
MSKEDNHLFVVAIDFGTTYSGYAFSARGDFSSDPLENIETNIWQSGNLVSHKTPTTLLLKHSEPDGRQEFVAFGYEAEDIYSHLAEGERDGYYYFRRFKMALYDEDRTVALTRETKLKDIKDKELLSLHVFSHSIEYLKKNCLEKFKKQDYQECMDGILWVLTVPAIWDDAAKQFMREAAIEAGLPKDRFMICLEPEAASVYCKYLPMEKLEEDSNLHALQSGRRFIVVDAGGGTIDMAVQEVTDDNKLQEIDHVQGGKWGGIYVDEEFKKLVEHIIGKPLLEGYRLSNTGDYIELFRFFEMKKRQTQSSTVRLSFPPSLLQFVQEVSNITISEATKQSECNQDITWRREKMQMPLRKFQELFDNVTQQIAQQVEKIISSECNRGTDLILLVGGFSESEVLQKRIKESFPNCKVVTPPEAGLSILRGAVLYGHDPSIIKARAAKYTYGVKVKELFDAKKHLMSKKEIVHGKLYCRDVFSLHIKKGSVISIHQPPVKKSYVPLYPEQSAAAIKVFASKGKPPQYTDEKDCEYLGVLNIKMPNTEKGLDREVSACLKFGGTELTIEGIDETSGEKVEAQLDFLAGGP